MFNHLTQVSRAILLSGLTVALLLIPGCSSYTVTSSTVSTTVGNRTVKATVDGAASISTINNVIYINLEKHKISLNQDSVQVDGKEVAKVPTAAKSIDIECSNNVLTIRADGAKVKSTRL